SRITGSRCRSCSCSRSRTTSSSRPTSPSSARNSAPVPGGRSRPPGVLEFSNVPRSARAGGAHAARRPPRAVAPLDAGRTPPRGAVGGLRRATRDALTLIAAAGYEWLLLETAGVGETELDAMRVVDTTVVVLVPESGDAIQAMKAGLMEAADVFLVNKADRAGAPALMAELKFAAHLHASSTASRRDVEWETPVLSLQAQHGVGIQELLADIRRHRTALEGSGAFAARRRERARAELEALLVDAFRGRIDRALHAGRVKAVFDEVVAGARDPYSAAAA